VVGAPGTAQAKPLLLVDPNWILIDQLPGSMHHPFGCCFSPADVISAKQESDCAFHWESTRGQ